MMNKIVEPIPETSGSRGPEKPPGQFVSRMKLLAILGCFAFPLLLASVWLYMVKASDGQLGVTARGQLVQPAVPLEPFSLNELGGDTFSDESLRGIWTMFYAPTGDCKDVCQKNLYHMRQVRLSLNHRSDRVQRAVLIEQEGQLSTALITEHPGVRVLSGERAELINQINAATEGMEPINDSIYLIDPFGNLMMRFPADLPPKSMLKDIKHLLKVSRIG